MSPSHTSKMISSSSLAAVVTLVLLILSSIISAAPTSQQQQQQSTPTKSSNSETSSSLPKTDLITDYILRDLLKTTIDNIDNRPSSNQLYQQAKLARPEWFHKKHLPLDGVDDNDNNNQQLTELYQSLLANYLQQSQSSPSLPESMFYPPGPPQLSSQSQRIAPLIIDDGQQDLGWFDGPVLPKVTPIINDNDDDGFNDDIGLDNQPPPEFDQVDNPAIIAPQLDLINNEPVDNQALSSPEDIPEENNELLNDLWTKYVASAMLNQLNQQDQESIPEPSEPSSDYRLEERLMNQLIDKRRLKVIKHEQQQHSTSTSTTTTSTTTEKPIVTSTTSTTKKVINTNQDQEKAKFLHKASKFQHSGQPIFQHQQQKHQPIVKVTMNGQKEYPMLRPASENKKNDDSGNQEPEQDWPSELDENTIAEEDYLKQLPKRDVLTNELDQLKMERPQQQQLKMKKYH